MLTTCHSKYTIFLRTYPREQVNNCYLSFFFLLVKQLNVSTGINNTPVSSVLYSDFPLAVYSVDTVLLPEELFGVKPPAAAPAPLPEKKKTKKTPTSDTAAVPSSSADAESTTSDANRRGQNAVLSIVFGVGIGALSYLM
jgi:hypothetical protein